MVQQPHRRVPGDSEPEDSDESSNNPLLDMEAEEDDYDETDYDDSDTGSYDSDGSFRCRRPFYPFVRLPPELRHRIWNFFCPEMRAPRVLEFLGAPDNYNDCGDWSPGDAPQSPLTESLMLPTQTLPARALMGVHRESRAIGIKAFPDKLRMRLDWCEADVAFHRERDIVLISDMLREEWFTKTDISPLSHVTQLALPADHSLMQQALPMMYYLVERGHLRRVFLWQREQDVQFSRQAWCASDKTLLYSSSTEEIRPGYGENVDVIYCWPDVDKHESFAKVVASQSAYARGFDEGAVEGLRVPTYPMIMLDSRKPWDALKMLGQYPEDHWSDSNENDVAPGDGPVGAASEDGYESSGIDDGSVVEVSDSEEDEVVPRSVLNHSSDDNDDRNSVTGAFSSPEPEGRAANNEATGGVYADSDSDAGPPAKRIRTGRAIMIDSDDEDAQPTAAAQSGTARNPRLIESESDEEEEEAAGVTASRTARSSGSRTVELSDEESSSEEEDEEDAQPRHISLAERLRIHREENPVPSPSGHNADSEESSSADSDSDSDSDSGSDDDSDSDENGLIDDMADESDSQDDDDDGDGPLAEDFDGN